MSSVCMRRLQRELRDIQINGISPTVHLAPRGDDLTKLDAIVMGLPDTPYDGAVMHFKVKIPPEYPMKPPELKYMSTEGGSLRIHPQLYAEGKVCLSILGTWHGPRWTASWSLRALLLSVQALLNDEPLRCEPGLENAPQDEVDRANVFVVHESVRALLLGCFAGSAPSWGNGESAELLTTTVQAHLSARREALKKKLLTLSGLHDGSAMRNPFVFTSGFTAMLWSNGKRYDFASLARQLVQMLPCADDDGSASAAVQGNNDSDSGSEQSEGDSDTETRCRICHQTAAESGAPLLVPCRCSGSIRFTHSDCLLRWMMRSAKPVASWRCDVCRQRLRVELGDGAPIGSRYLWREIDIIDAEDFYAPGLVSVLLISFMQMLMSLLGAGFVRGALKCSDVASAAGCSLLSFAVLCLAIFLECGRMFSYDCLCALKLRATCVGACWRPAEDFGQFGEDWVLPVLTLAAEVLNSLPEARALAFLVGLVGYMAVSQITGSIYGQSLLVVFVRSALGFDLPPAPPTNQERFPALATLLPDRLMGVVGAYTLLVGAASLLMNMCAIVKLVKRAYVDCQPVPLRLMPLRAAPTVGGRAAAGRKDGSGGDKAEQRVPLSKSAGQGVAKRKARGKKVAS